MGVTWDQCSHGAENSIILLPLPSSLPSHSLPPFLPSSLPSHSLSSCFPSLCHFLLFLGLIYYFNLLITVKAEVGGQARGCNNTGTMHRYHSLCSSAYQCLQRALPAKAACSSSVILFFSTHPFPLSLSPSLPPSPPPSHQMVLGSQCRPSGGTEEVFFLAEVTSRNKDHVSKPTNSLIMYIALPPSNHSITSS